jgi:hypothetical protein
MKKKLLTIVLLIISVAGFAQTDYYDVVPDIGSTSGNARAPQGSRRYARSVYLVPAADITAEGMVNGDVINSIVFKYVAAQDVATTGNLILYLQNTTDTSNLKSTTWATAITGMTTVSNATLNIPNTIGDLVIPFSGGSPFTYTGGGVYVAFDYSNPSGTIATTNSTVACNTNLTGGLVGGQSQTVAPTTGLIVSNFRPATHFGKPVSCARPVYLNVNTASTTLNSALLSWNPIGGANVDIQYGTYGFALGSGTTMTNVVSPLTLNSLAPNTVYDYYVRTNCGGGNYSSYNGPYAFTTLWNAATPPYNTSFEHENLPFVGWATPNATPVAGDWSIGYYGPGALVQNGNSSVVSITPAAAAANNWMFSRGVNLTSGSNVTITYYISNYQSGTTNTGSYQLTVGNAQSVASQTTVVGSETGLNTAAFTLKTFNFTPSSTGVYYFGFRNTSAANAAGTHALIVDNFTVTQVLSTSDFVASKLSVYPNPVNNILNITNNAGLQINKTVITDINGRTVKTLNHDGVSELQINISDLNAGIYFMNIETNEGTATKKIIKN